MIITIDTRWIRSYKVDGISRVTFNIVKNTLTLDKKNKYQLLFCDAGIKKLIQKELTSSFHNYKFIKTDIQVLSLREVFNFRKFLTSINTEIFYSPFYITFPFSKSFKTIITIYDLIYFFFSKILSKSSLRWRLFYKFLWPTKYLLNKADYVVTSSQNTKKDLIKYFKIASDKIKVIYCGTHADLCEITPKHNINKYHLPNKYILYVGRLDPYKNIAGLIEAYNLLNKSIREKIKLVIVGDKKSPYYPSLRHLVTEYNLEKDVIFTGYIPEQDLPNIYKKALIFTFPSLYEGFGLPVLEAMACGVPVLTSNKSSLLEIAGNAALLVNPKDIEEISRGIETLLMNDKLRNDLIEKGVNQVKKFSWKKSAEKLIKIFEKV
jgi:glycosyltransferase involved in cell wall biosynthesis